MGYVHGISLKNFRVFHQEQNLPLAAITVFTGTNGSGKSTVSEALRLLKIIFSRDVLEPTSESGFNLGILFQPITSSEMGPRVGDLYNLKNWNTESELIEIGMPLLMASYPRSVELRLKIRLNRDTDSEGQLEEFLILDKDLEETLLRFSLKKETSGGSKPIISGQINYKVFYNNYLSNAQLVSSYFELAKKRKQSDAMGLELSQDLKNQIQEIQDKVIGDLDPSVLAIDADLDLYMLGEKPDFKREVQYMNGLLRILPSFQFDFREPLGIVSLDKSEEDSLSGLLDLFNKKRDNGDSTIENDNSQDFNLFLNEILIDRLSGLEFIFSSEVGSYDYVTVATITDEGIKPPATPANSFYNLTITVEQILNEFGVKFPVDVLRRPPLRINRGPIQHQYFDGIISKFGFNFFREVIYGLISAVENIRDIRLVEQFDHQMVVPPNRYLDRHSGGNLVKAIRLNGFNHPHIKPFFEKWLGKLGLGETMRTDSSGNTISIILQRQERHINISDEGSGFSRLLPLLIQLCNACAKVNDAYGRNSYDKMEYSMIILEEPEIGLHPALQSVLADLIIDAYQKLNLQIIVETHSEYLIRKLQVLVARREIQEKEIQIHYFHHPAKIPEGQPQCFPIKILADGALSRNFGTGFFDEGTNLNLSLYGYYLDNRN